MDLPRKEYPRPLFERNDWINLNGTWSCAFDFIRSGEAKEWHKKDAFEMSITVPFAPESTLSSVGMTDFIDVIYYQRNIEIPPHWEGKKILLHFGGVDYKATIYIDGREAGRHTGGSTPFTVEIDPFVKPGKVHNLVVRAEDDPRSGLQPCGKQSLRLKSAVCSYTRTTGIWQTVWMEAVDKYALKTCRILPDFDNSSFSFLPVFYDVERDMKLEIKILDNGKEVTSKKVAASNGSVITLLIPDPKKWDTETPFLYDVEYLLYNRDGVLIDSVRSYAGLRKIHLENGRVYLNNKPIFLRFVLDQGFYEDGLWTAPSDEALKQDILLAQKAGFNGARLHQKVFEERFHYWADRLGYLTWAEFPDWGMNFWQHFGQAPADYMRSFRDYFAQWSEIVERDVNHPSIITWTPFNETIGFYDKGEHRRILSDIYDLTHRLDPSRPVNDSSGFTHAKTDIWSVHIYAQDAASLREKVEEKPVFMLQREFESPAWNNQPYIIAEYGGVSYLPEGRKPYAEDSWGYNKQKLTRTETQDRITELTAYLVSNPQVAGYCYTQLTDIEQEQNGIYNYDRTEKFDMEVIAKCFSVKPDWSDY